MAKDKFYVERNGKIYARFYFTDSQGKLREKWKRVENKTEAKQWVADQKQLLKSGTEPFEHNGTLDEFLDKWLETQKHKVSPRTYEDYFGTMRLYVRPALGSRKISNLRPLDIQSLINGLVEKGLSPRTVRYATAILSRALKRAVSWKMIIQNPATELELPKYVKREMKSLSLEQAQVFLSHCKDDKYGLMLELALITAMRPEEYLGLQWSDVDFQKETVAVRRTLVWKRWIHEWYFGEPKSEKSRRTLPMPSYFMKELIEHKRKQNEHRLKLGEKWQNYDLVFPSDTGTPLSIRNLERRHFKPVLVKAKLPDILGGHPKTGHTWSGSKPAI